RGAHAAGDSAERRIALYGRPESSVASDGGAAAWLDRAVCDNPADFASWPGDGPGHLFGGVHSRSRDLDRAAGAETADPVRRGDFHAWRRLHRAARALVAH